MTVAAFIEQLKADPSFMANVSAMREMLVSFSNLCPHSLQRNRYRGNALISVF